MLQVVMGGGEQFLTTVAGTGPVSTRVGVRMQFSALGSGKLCFKYSGSTQPASTAGWREIGSWTVNASAVPTTTTTMTTPTTTAVATTTAPAAPQTLTVVVYGERTSFMCEIIFSTDVNEVTIS